ncbi:MAG: C10 family peptidase [Bacteroidaceae bacterium]|nr:C10 family peptidase [Bacteroidaceae bacterium]
MRKTILLFLLFSFFLQHAYAQQRTLEQSKAIASNYLKNKGVGMSPDRLMPVVSSRKMMATTDGETPFYILYDKVTSVIVIVSADERMKDVLGYSNSGTETTDNMPEALLELLDTYRLQYDFLQTAEGQKVMSAPPIQIPDVKPLLNTTWKQSTPYNDQCPGGCPSGCVATAMSQVMNYHHYPTKGNDTFSYTSATRKYKCSYDFASATFNWDVLQKSYPSRAASSSLVGREEIAKITYACGVSVGMDYDKNGSGAYMSDVPYALIHFFGYNQNVTYCYRPYYKAEEWYKVLCHELEEGRPVLYGGVDSRNGGHAFVVDGCDSKTGKFHVNWGWGGDYDGDYELDAMNPTGYKFSTYQSMVINVSPQEVGTFRDVFYADKFAASDFIELDKTIAFTLTEIYCFSNLSSYVVTNAKFNGILGVGIFDSEFNFVTSIDSESVDGLNNFYGYDKITFKKKITRSMFPENGIYYIAPYVQSSVADVPSMIRTKDGKTDYIKVTISDDGVDEEKEVEEHEMVAEWSEGFESLVIPKSWTQERERGLGEWKARSLLIPSEENPMAASGRGYAYLDYTPDISDIFNARTAIRLVTSTIPLSSLNAGYNLSFQYRKYTTNPEPTDVLSVYYEQNGEWISLADVIVTNHTEWEKTVLDMPVNGDVRLAFCGSLSKSASLFLDDIKIYKKEDVSTSVEDPPTSVYCKDLPSVSTYTLTGVKVSQETMHSHPGIYIQNGKKVFVR